MRRPTRNTTRITESRLRQLIKSVIYESDDMPDQLDRDAFDSDQLDRYDRKKINWASMDSDDFIRYPEGDPAKTQALINACVNSNQQKLRSFFQELVNEFQESPRLRGAPSKTEFVNDNAREKVIKAMLRLIGGIPES